MPSASSLASARLTASGSISDVPLYHLSALILMCDGAMASASDQRRCSGT
jgi:hypothetical protein